MPFYKPAATDHPGSPLSLEAVAEWKKFLKPYVRDESLLRPLDELVRENATVVVTGQQAGFALGPIYTVIKALDAKLHADAIAAKTKRPCVPVFWVASDDHDLGEVESISWAGKNGELHTHRNLHEQREYLASCSIVQVPESASDFLQKFAESTNESAFRPEILETLTRAFTDTTYESQFLTLFCEWLLPLGIVPVVPRLGFIRRAAQPILKSEVAEFERTNHTVQRAGAKMRELGVDPPLGRSGNELNFFIDIDGIRAKLVSAGGKIEARVPDESKQRLHAFDERELTALIDEQPWRFSPNAILRPLVQDAAFPTVMYVGGSSELLYHGQLGELYAQFGVTRPAVVPRSNVALIDPRAEKALAKLGVDASQVASFDREEITRIITEAAASGSELDDIRRQAEEIATLAGKLDQRLRSMTNDTGVVKASEKFKSSVEQGREKVLERVEYFLSTRNADRAAARDRILEALFPGGNPQERTLSILSPFLVQNGAAALGRLSGKIVSGEKMNIIFTSELRD